MSDQEVVRTIAAEVTGDPQLVDDVMALSSLGQDVLDAVIGMGQPPSIELAAALDEVSSLIRRQAPG
jgi:hypothetical protein